MNNDWPIRFDLLLRYRLIEIVAYWEGRLTTNHLVNSFGIGRQQASKDINAYLNEIAPNNLIYNKHLKGYEPSPQFKPRVTTGTADEYLHVLSRTKDLAHTFASLDLGFTNTHMLQLPSRKVDPVILRTIVHAAREQKRVDIGYTSVNNPATDGRIIVPHTLVCTPMRWHVRAYCEKNGQYRDFVLSRFRGEPDLLGKSEHGKSDDAAWNTHIELSITPDPRLEKPQQQVIAYDYGMTRNKLAVPCKAALLQYVLKAYGLDPHKQEAKPEAQQVVIGNYKTVEPWL
jgi:predicted DNA-binding transcriptional regulator YafY